MRADHKPLNRKVIRQCISHINRPPEKVWKVARRLLKFFLEGQLTGCTSSLCAGSLGVTSRLFHKRCMAGLRTPEKLWIPVAEFRTDDARGVLVSTSEEETRM